MHLVSRILPLFLAAAALPAFAGALAGGWRGAVVGAALACLALVRAFFSSERWIARMLGARELSFAPLERTFSEALRSIDPDARLARPRLRVFPDPVTNVLAVRSLASPGAVYLSQGALNQLDEEGLREALRVSMLRLQRGDWRFKSACSAIASGIIARAPRGWMAFLFAKAAPRKSGDKAPPLGVGPLIAAVTLLPWLRLLLSINPPLSPGPTRSGALQRAFISHPRNGLSERVALDSLFLIPAAAGDRISGASVSS